ncbi:MAG: CarD family transcriptional regulator [Chitinophagaceae bacterium]
MLHRSQVFQRYHKYKVKQAYNKSKALTLRTLRELQPGDYVTHIDHGVGVYSGLQKLESERENAGRHSHYLQRQ